MFIAFVDKSSLKDRIKDDMKKMRSKDDERHEESLHHRHEKDHHHHNHHEKHHHRHKDPKEIKIDEFKDDLKSSIIGDVADKMNKVNSIFDRDNGRINIVY